MTKGTLCTANSDLNSHSTTTAICSTYMSTSQSSSLNANAMNENKEEEYLNLKLVFGRTAPKSSSTSTSISASSAQTAVMYVRVNARERVSALYRYTGTGVYFICGEKFLYDDIRFHAFGIESGAEVRVVPADVLPSHSEFCAMVRMESQRINLNKAHMMMKCAWI